MDEQHVGCRGKIPGRRYVDVDTYSLCHPSPKNTAWDFLVVNLILDSLWKLYLHLERHSLINSSKFCIWHCLWIDWAFLRNGQRTCIRYFTSYHLAKFLLTKTLTLLGTIQSNCCKVPFCLETTRGRELFSTQCLYNHSEQVTLLFYIPKPYRNVLLLTTSYSCDNIGQEERKPSHICK